MHWKRLGDYKYLVKTLPDIFVNIQHPGETILKADLADPTKYLSHWPANAGYGAGGATTARPRSATIVITKNDGGLIGT